MVKQIFTALSLGLLGTVAAKDKSAPKGIAPLDVFQVLNVDHNIAFRYADGALQGLDYDKDTQDWGDIHRFMYFQAEVYTIDGTSYLKWWVDDDKFEKIVYNNAEKKFVTHPSEVGEDAGEGLTDKFVIRRSTMTDNHGGHPAYITAKIGSSTEFALNCAAPKSKDTYGVVDMKAFSSAEDLSGWNRFYFAKTVPLESPEDVWNFVDLDSTYYFFNRDSKSTLTTEKDEQHNLSVSAEWGDSNRFTLMQRDKPFFEMYNYSKKTRDNAVEGSDFRVRTKSDHLTIEVGRQAIFKAVKADVDSHPWCYLVNGNGNNVYHKDGHIRDNGTGSSAHDHWQMVRVYNDAAGLANSGAEDL